MSETRTATARRSAASDRGATASGERPDRAAAGSWPVRERSLIGPVLGIPPVAAVALAVGLTAIGVVVDLLRVGTVATIFQIAYGAGCLLAVAWVRRRSIFLPAIQPPLLLAVVIPVLAVLVGAPSSTAGVTEHLLLAGAPLINAFPAMAVTTGLVLVLAGYRLVRQRTGPDDAVGLLRARLSGRRSGGDDAAGPRGGRDAVSDRGRSRATDRKPATRRPVRDAQGAGRDRDASSRTRTGTRDDASRRSGSRGTGRPSGSRGRAGSDEGPPDGARRSPQAPTGRGGSRGGTPRGSGSGGSSDDRARTRRPRPSDPT